MISIKFPFVEALKLPPFASLRSVQGAVPLAPLRGYPCTLAGKVHPLRVCIFPARLKPNTVTLDRLPDTAGTRSFILPKRRSNTMEKSRGEMEKSAPRPTPEPNSTSIKFSGWKNESTTTPRARGRSRTTALSPVGQTWRAWPRR